MPRAAFCKAEAERLRRDNKIFWPPVDVYAIAASLLLEVVPKPVWYWRSRALLKRDIGEIWVNANETPHGQRFSVGHEIGHFVLHPDQNVFSEHADPDSSEYSDDPDKALETEADYFSSVLLVPPEWLRRDVSSGCSPAELSALYDVSSDVIFIALKEHRLLTKVRTSPKR
jgi:Zn-dependent peptidase ImmA (M78 family)